MAKKVFVFLLILCMFNTMTVCAESNTKVFTIFDGVTFSSSLETIEECMENNSYQKVARYGLFDQYGFYSDDALVLGEIADTVWFDMENGELNRIRILYEADSDVFKIVLNSLLDVYGISVFDYNDDNAKVYAWWSDDAQIFFGGAPWDSSIEDAENGDVLSMITITPCTTTVWKRFKRIAVAIGAEESRFHDLRHSFATLSIEAGSDIKTVSESLGHATTAFTMDVYGHTSERMQQEHAQKLQAHISSLL